MHVDLTPDDVAFRDELRRWLDANLRYAGDAHEWHRRLVEGRWVVPAWPARWGGRACSLTQEIIFNQEMGARDDVGGAKRVLQNRNADRLAHSNLRTGRQKSGNRDEGGKARRAGRFG